MEAAELYNPATGTWTTMESQQANCIYHSAALLLPDGRVISAERAKKDEMLPSERFRF